MSELLEKLREIFRQIQYSRRNHPQYLAKMKKYYQKTDETVFAKAFITCLAEPLSYAEKHPKVESSLEFAAKFAIGVHLYTGGEKMEGEETEDEEQLCPFWDEIFDFILSHHNVGDVAIRFRLCYFLNMLLNSMGDNASIDDALCDRIRDTMMQRLLDKVPKIRSQAILALHRLQDPSDENCPVIKTFIFHLNKDPQAEVRRAVLTVLARNRETLAAALKRTRDINEGVRKLAYTFLSKITVRSLKIEQREQLLKDGLRDRSEKVSTYVKTQLLPAWLDNYDGEFVKLLRALDAEKALATSILALQVLFKAAVIRNIVEQVPVDRDTKLIPFDKLTSESVIYWRCAAEHLHRQGCQDELENILPDLSKFCKYINEFIEFTKQGTREHWESATLRFILLQLFEITETHDLSDEVGRENLRQLIFDILKSDNNSEELIDSIVRRLALVIPDAETRLNSLAEVISEIRLPLSTETVPMSEAENLERDMKRAKFKVQLMQVQEEQYEAVKNKDYMEADHLDKKMQVIKGLIEALNTEMAVDKPEEELQLKDDEETLVKCLQIMFSMMQSVKTLYPMLRGLFESMVLPCLDHPSDRVMILSIKATAVCCLFDENLAKTHLPLFFIQFGIENHRIWLVSLQGLFDLLVFYGLERLGMIENVDINESDTNQTKRHRSVRLYRNADDEDEDISRPPPPCVGDTGKNIINILIALLDNTDQDLRTTAAEGLCKLLLHQKISSGLLLSRLIILWHNPVTTDDVYMRQCLSHFFNQYPVVVPNSQQIMEDSFLSTLKILAKAPATSPLSDIDPVKVAQLIIYIIKIGNQRHPLGYEPHNHLAIAIIAEALNDDSVIDPGVIIRTLKFLTINLEDEATIKLLQEAVEKLLSKVEITDKRAVNTLKYFKKTLYGEDPKESEEEQAAEDEPMIEDDSEEFDNDEMP